MLLALLLAGVWSATSRGHAGHDERLARSSERLATRPADARLLLERADLYRRAGMRAEAAADLARAASLAPRDPSVAVLRARLALDARDARTACDVLDSLLERAPRHGEARALRADALDALGRNGEAADELERAIPDLRRPTPEHYVLLARLLCATEPPQAARAERALVRGIEALGPAPALIERAVELELARGRPTAALVWHDRLAPFAGSNPAWNARRGELLQAADRPLEALAAFTHALEAIEALEPRRRAAPATVELEAGIRSRLRGTSQNERSRR
jgi:tetratricopeptide (TPR) repeat protein